MMSVTIIISEIMTIFLVCFLGFVLVESAFLVGRSGSCESCSWAATGAFFFFEKGLRDSQNDFFFGGIGDVARGGLFVGRSF